MDSVLVTLKAVIDKCVASVGDFFALRVSNPDGTNIFSSQSEAQTVKVAKSNGDYSVIQTAIDAITDASATKQYTIEVYPGIYTEAITMKDHVSLLGVAGNRDNVEIAQSSGTVLTFNNGSDNVVKNIKINATGTAEAVNLPSGMGTNVVRLWNCNVVSGYAAHADDLITVNSGTLYLIHTEINYVATGGATTHRLIYISGASTKLIVHASEIYADIDDTGANNFVAFEIASGANCNVLIAGNLMEFDLETTGTNCIYNDLDTIGSTERIVYNNHIHVEGVAGATGYAFCLGNIATSLDSSINTIEVTGHDFNYLADILAAATLISHMDNYDVDVEIYTGAGIYTEVNSPEAGKLEAINIKISNELSMERDLGSAVAGETHTLIDTILQVTGSTGGDAHVLDVALGGSGSIDVDAVGTHDEVGVIHQQIGTFAEDEVWNHTGGAFIDASGGGVTLLQNDNDYVYIGHETVTFSEIAMIFSTPSSHDQQLTFEYWSGAAWTVFVPADDTNGFRQNGNIRFEAGDLSGWAKVDPAAETGDPPDAYYIKITRTRNNVNTDPVLTSAKVAAITDYTWDKNGDLIVKSIALTNNTIKADYLAEFSAGAFDYPTTNYAEVDRNTGTNGDIFAHLFDDTTEEFILFDFKVPPDPNTTGTVTFYIDGFAVTAAASKNVEFTFYHSSKTAGESWDAAFSSKVSGDLATDSTQDELDQFSFTETFANLGWAAGDNIRCKIGRTAPSADNLSGDYGVRHVRVRIPRG